MQNNIANLSIADLLKLGNKCATTALAIGQDVGLAQNKAEKIDADYSLAKACFLAVQAESANRVAKADALGGLLATTRTWCFRAKDTLKPYLGESHNVLYRPTGFVSSLRVPEDYDGLFALADTLQKYFVKHPEQTNPAPKVNVTAARAGELRDALKAASLALENHDELIGDKQEEQDTALEALRDRLRGVINELKQVLPEDDRRWKRFGFNIPAEPETPAQPEQVQVNNALPGRLVMTCPPVSFAERFRYYFAKVGTTGEPELAGSSTEPLFVFEGLEAGARYNLFMAAVNASGNEGLKSKVLVAEVLARAAS